MRAQRGQVLAFFAVVLPTLLLPIVAYAVDATALGVRAAGLEAATAQAVEVAVQQLDVDALRAQGRLAVDPQQARAAALQVLLGDEPRASLDSLTSDSEDVTIVASEQVDLPFPWLEKSVALHARAAARLVPGYVSPSSRLPLPSSTF